MRTISDAFKGLLFLQEGHSEIFLVLFFFCRHPSDERVGTTTNLRIFPCALENSWLSYLTGTERLHIHKIPQQEPYFVQMRTNSMGEICTNIPHYIPWNTTNNSIP